MNIDKIKSIAEKNHAGLIEIRRDFHAHPELGKNEFRTQQKICGYLDEMGIKYYKIANTGIVGIIEGKADEAADEKSESKAKSKTVALRADIDALPMQEKNNVPYKSKTDGVMHACGHDVHTTILIGAAKILNEIKNEFCGNVKLFFQPDEEGDGGAERMVNEGCMENPVVDYVVGLHVMSYMDCGKIEIKRGKLNAATDSVRITVRGLTAHGAYPDKGIDAITISAHVITALQTLVSRNISPLNSVVLSFGKISGGEVSNAIADEVLIKGTLRTLDEETRCFCKKRIEEIAGKTAEALGGKAEVVISCGYKSLINNDEVVNVVEESGAELLGRENVYFKEFPSLGGEDFSYFMDKAKGAFYHLGIGNKARGIIAPIHNSSFDIDENALLIGTELQVINALKLLKK